MRKIFLRLFFVSGFTCIFFIARTNQSGPGSGYTNAPSESHCATSGCHTGSSLVTSGTNWNRISLKNNFTGSGYIPDSTYELVLTYRESGMSNSGFQITCLDKTNSPAGTFATKDSRTQAFSGTVGGKTRRYLGHTSTGTSTVSGDSSSYRIEWTAPNKNLGDLTFYVTWNKGNGNGQNSGDLIYAKTFTAGPSSLLPTAKVKIQESTYCSNSPLTFDANTTGSPNSFTWNFPNGNPSNSTAQNPKVTYFTPGTYKAILTVKNNKGSSLPDTLNFTVIQGASLPVISPGGLSEICSGDSIQLSANNLAGHSYLWSPGNMTNRIVKVADSGVYTVTVTNTSGCSRTSSPVTIKVNPSPSVLAIKSFSGDSICTGTPFSVGGLVISGTVDSFSYTSKSGPFVKADTLSAVLNSGSKTYSVWGKDSKGCVSKESKITVHSKPRPSGPVLSSSDISYTGFKVNWQAVPNSSGYRVSIDSGKTYIVPSSGSSGLTHEVTGLIGNHTMNVRVFALMPGICSSTEISSISITTLSCSPLDFELTTGKNRLCKGSFATVNIGKVSGKTIGIQIDGKFSGVDTIQKILVTGTREYTVSVIDSNALICGYTHKTILLTEDTSVTPIIQPSGLLSFCSNAGTVDLTIGIINHEKMDSSFVFKNNQLVYSGNKMNPTISASDGDSIWVKSTNKSGCLSEKSTLIRVIVKPVPNAGFNISNTHFNYTFTANDTQGNHSWYVGQDSTTGKSALFDLINYANDTATVTHKIVRNGCVSTETKKIYVPDFALVKLKDIPGARIYPNPASGMITVFWPVENADGYFELINQAGQTVLVSRIKAGDNEIFTELLAPGHYNFRMMSGKTATTGSLIIAR